MRSHPRYTTTRISVADSRALLAKGRAVPRGLRRQIGEFAATPNLTAREAEMRDGLLVVRGRRSRVALLRRWFALRGVKVALPTLTRAERRAGYDLPHHRDAWGALRAEGHHYGLMGLLGGSAVQGVNLKLEEARILMGAGRWHYAIEAVAKASAIMAEHKMNLPPLLRKMTLAYYEIVVPCRINNRQEGSFELAVEFISKYRMEIMAWEAAGKPTGVVDFVGKRGEAVLPIGAAFRLVGHGGELPPTVSSKSEVATFSASVAIKGN